MLLNARQLVQPTQVRGLPYPVAFTRTCVAPVGQVTYPALVNCFTYQTAREYPPLREAMALWTNVSFAD